MPEPAEPWPSGFAPRGVQFGLRGVSIGGPASATGFRQLVQSDAGFWTASLTQIPMGTAAKVNAWRAFLARLDGGARHALVPVFDLMQAPWALAGGPSANLLAEQAFSDGYYFTDGHGFFNAAIVITLSADAALRDTSISVTVTTAGTIQEGMGFTLGGDRLHRIKAILADNGAGAQTWQIAPPLRADYASGTELNFDRPTCRMRLLAEDDGEAALDYGRYGFANMNLVEALV